MKNNNLKSERTASIQRISWFSLILNIVLSVLKFFAGIFAGSQAVVADSIHSFSDSFTDVAVIWGAKYWDLPPDTEHPHGHQRLEILLALCIAAALAFTACLMVYTSIIELHDHKTQTIGIVAAIAAFISVVVKEGLYRWTMVYAKKLHSQLLAVNAWHHRSDGLSSIPVTITSIIAYFKPDWYFLDHIGAVVVSLFIFIAAYKLGRPAFNQLIDAGASKEVTAKLKMIVSNTDDVINVHNLRTRYIGSSSIAVDMHVVVDGLLTVKQGHDIAEDIEARIAEQLPQAIDIVVHIEPKE